MFHIQYYIRFLDLKKVFKNNFIKQRRTLNEIWKQTTGNPLPKQTQTLNFFYFSNTKTQLQVGFLTKIQTRKKKDETISIKVHRKHRAAEYWSTGNDWLCGRTVQYLWQKGRRIREMGYGIPLELCISDVLSWPLPLRGNSRCLLLAKFGKQSNITFFVVIFH